MTWMGKLFCWLISVETMILNAAKNLPIAGILRNIFSTYPTINMTGINLNTTETEQKNWGSRSSDIGSRLD